MSYIEDIKAVCKLDLPWDKLSGSNILITGATGLIGSCLVEVLMSRAERDYHVFASGRNIERAKKRFCKYLSESDFHFVPFDVLRPLESSVDFHYIIHAASNASPIFFATKPVEIINANVNGVNNLITYGLSHSLKRFLFVSSGEVYGEGDGRPFSEEYSGYVDCTKPRSCYPASKRAAENLAVSYGAEYGVDTVIVRPSHTYGPNFTSDDNRVYAQFIRNVLNGEDIVMKSKGEQYRSWCYVVDCVSAILYVLFKGESGQAYNIADDNSNISIKQLAEMIASIGGKKVVVDLPSEIESKGFNVVTKSVFVTDKLQSLGWKIEGDMKDKMSSTISCLR